MGGVEFQQSGAKRGMLSILRNFKPQSASLPYILPSKFMQTTLGTVDGRGRLLDVRHNSLSGKGELGTRASLQIEPIPCSDPISIRFPAMESLYWDFKCKCWWSFVVAALLLCSFRVPATVAQTNPVFLNIDCGATDTYVDPVTGFTWVPDTAYISTGKLQRPAVPTNLQNFSELYGLRSFDDARAKNCFTLPVVNSTAYLLRATFFYGNYDNKNQPPSFQLALDATVLDNVTASSGDDVVFREYHYIAQGNGSILCLLRTSPEQTPFISGISLKLASGIAAGYVDNYGALLENNHVMKTRLRLNYGATELIRGPDDFYDRYWFPESPTANVYLAPTTAAKEFLSTTIPFSYLIDQEKLPPSAVMQTAVSCNGTLASLLPASSEISWYVAVYYGELVQYAGTPVPRNFTINVLGLSFAVNLPGVFEEGYYYDAYNPRYSMKANETLTLTPTGGSLKGPIINAMELFAVTDPMRNKTNRVDALAIEGIKEDLNLTEWTGDPCLPSPHPWITCFPIDDYRLEPRITAVNLSGYQLEGSIPNGFANLLALTSLSLDNNNLSGPVPQFLATVLKDLRVLSIQSNNFSGVIPEALLATNSPISFTYRPGNPLLVEPSGSTPSSSKKSSNIGAIVGATIGGILGVLLLLILAFLVHRRCKRKAPSPSDGEGTGIMAKPKRNALDLSDGERARIMKIPHPGGAKAYSYAEVDVATNHFTRELGRGGFGPVYYGVLSGGQEVAAKVADKFSKQGEKEFCNEVDVLLRVHHKNLVALLGYCQSNDDSILIYEYVSNGSLFNHLHGSMAKANLLNWKRRLHIGLNAAQGLEYLHTGCNPSFIHRDVKSGNILLTPHFDAKVADFGLAKLMGDTESTRVLTEVMGTAGYLDPEYYTTQYIHTKSDVYSFGIVLLELLTGRLPIDQSFASTEKNPHIAHWVRENLQSNNIYSILAPTVKASNPNMEAVWKVVDIAMQSVEPKSIHRPLMIEVVQELQGALTLEGGPIVAPEFHSRYSDNSSMFEMGPSSFPKPR